MYPDLLFSIPRPIFRHFRHKRVYEGTIYCVILLLTDYFTRGCLFNFEPPVIFDSLDTC